MNDNFSSLKFKQDGKDKNQSLALKNFLIN